MLTLEVAQSFSFKMSVESLGFPLPVKIEEDQKMFIDLDTEGNSPEDIVIEWHLEITRFFGSYSADSGEIKLISMMKEYITAITERAIHFESIDRLHDMVEHHVEHIYWFYRDSDICFSDTYLNYMEHIMTFYVNLSLRVLLVWKKKVKVNQNYVTDMSQKIIKRLSFYLLKSEYHIFHVLIRQTTTLHDGMIKDVMNISNSNLCRHVFRNLYMHYLVLTPVNDVSDEAFCRAYILFENWKACEDKQVAKINQCMKDIFNQDLTTIRNSEFLSKILTPKTSILSELMKVLGCDPSITKAYFDHIRSKQKVESEVIDDIGKLALEDTLLNETELVDEDDDDNEYMECFDKIMVDINYDLKEVVLDFKNERNPVESASVQGDDEILILDTDSDSDVEIVSIIPCQSSTRRGSTPTQRSRNPLANTQPVTSFLDSISVDVDTTSRKYAFRTLGNFGTTQSQSTTPETSISANTSSETVRRTNEPAETCVILDDDDVCEIVEDNISVDLSTDQTSTEKCNNESISDVVEAEALQTETAKTDNVSSTHTEDSSSSVSKEPTDISALPMEVEVSNTPCNLDQSIEEDTDPIDGVAKTAEVSSSSNTNEEETTPKEAAPSTEKESSLEIIQISKDTNDATRHLCIYSPPVETPFLKEHTITSTTQEMEKVIVERIPPLEEISKTVQIADIFLENVLNVPVTEEHVETVRVPEDMGVSRADHVEVAPEIANSETLKEKTIPLSLNEDDSVPSAITTEKSNDASSVGLELQLNALSIATVSRKSCVTPSEISNKSSENSESYQKRDRTLPTEKVIVVSNSVIDSEVLKCPTECGTGLDEANTIPSAEMNDKVDSVTDTQIEAQSTPLDTGQDLFVEALGTGPREKTVEDSRSRTSYCGRSRKRFKTNKKPDTHFIPSDEDSNDNSWEHNNEYNVSSSSDEDTGRSRLKAQRRPSQMPFAKYLTKRNGARIAHSCSENSKTYQKRDRTLQSEKVVEVSNSIIDSEVLKCRTVYGSGCDEETTVPYAEVKDKIDSVTDTQIEEQSTPLDTGQDPFVEALDTGQFDANSPASPDALDIPHEKDEGIKILRTIPEPLLRKDEQHGEFGYPTPPGSEEEREKDTDKTDLIYPNILPNRTFGVDQTSDPHDALTANDDFIYGEVEVSTTKIIDRRLSEEEREVNANASPSLGKSYEQIVKDAVGSQNSTEDEDETIVFSEKTNTASSKTEDFLDSMEHFLKNCHLGPINEKRPGEENENEDVRSSTNDKRPREENVIDDGRGPLNCKRLREENVIDDGRVLINNKRPREESVIDDDRCPINNKRPREENVYDDGRSISVSRAKPKKRVTIIEPEKSEKRPKAQIRPPSILKYPIKPNGINIYSPPSGRLHSLHQVEDEPETVVIVLHQRELGKGKRGSVEVKVYRKSFSAYKVPFDDHKLCHHAFVKLQVVNTNEVNSWVKMSVRTRMYEEELYEQPEKPMYKIVFDKQTPQLNSNDRKYYCDPSISSDSAKPKTIYESEQGTVNLSTEIAYVKTPDQMTTEPAIPPHPISPPCFSPSSNSSSEFSDPTNLIPYQDIERALQVVEPDKSEEDDEPGVNLVPHDSNDGTDKTIVDRLALETIELLSNNADFHKMLRDLNGEIFIENLPIISIEDASVLGNVVAVTENDLVSNLNSDEQLLKKVCQELESEALVDNLDSRDQLVVDEDCADESSLVIATEEQEPVSEVAPETICYQADHDIQVSSFTNVPIPLHVSNKSVRMSPVPVAYSDKNLPVLETPADYSVPVLNSLRQDTYSSVPELPLAHSKYPEAAYPQLKSPTFPPKLSPIIPPLSPFHPDLYNVAHYPANLSYSDRNSPKIPRNSPHHQGYSSVTNLSLAHTVYAETNFSVPTTANIIPSPIIPLGQDAYSDSSLIHPGYSEMSVPNSQLNLPMYGSSNPAHQTLKPFIPNSSVGHPLYPEGSRLLRSPPSTLHPYPQSTSISPSSYTSNLDTNPYLCNLPQYTEPNSLIPTRQSYSDRKLLVPTPPLSVPTYTNSIAVISNSPSVHTYLEPVPSTSKSSPPSHEQRSLRSCRYDSNSNVKSSKRNHSHTKNTQGKTDKRKNRLPKEVLTISQINSSKTSDNKSKTNSASHVKRENLGLVESTNALSLGVKEKKIELNLSLKSKKMVRKKSPSKVGRSMSHRLGQPILRTIAKKSLSRARKLWKMGNERISSRKITNTPSPKVVPATPKALRKPSPLKEVLRSQNLPPDESNKRDKPKAPVRKRGRPPKNAKKASNSGKKHESHAHQNIPSNSIPLVANNVNYNERVPVNYHDVTSKNNSSEQRPRIEPLKIIKDPNSKNGYAKVVAGSSKAPVVPMPVPQVHNVASDKHKKETLTAKSNESGDNEVEFETHLPLKKRKLSMPVQSAQPTTLANVPRTRARKDDISYPATPMLSIADVYMQPRTFKTPAEKKQLPPESSNSMCYEPQSDPQFNCNLNAYTPAIYGFPKCPYGVELDCNPYCPPPVLFPPESFNHTN